jgi:hypothetical protein
MPLIFNIEEQSVRGNHVTIKKVSESAYQRTGLPKAKLYSPNRTMLAQQVDFVNHFKSKAFVSPTLMAFSMGSGKSFGALSCALELFDMGIQHPHVIIVCDLSILGQWANEVRRLHSPPGLTVDLLNYHQFEKMTADDAFVRSVRKADLMIVDECQIFRNLSGRMLRMVNIIRTCPRVLLLSGTVVVNDAEDALGFQQLAVGHTTGTLAAAAKGRVAFYDPALMPVSAKFYPRQEQENVIVEMTYPQTLLYLSNKESDFKLPLGGGDQLRVSRPVQNRYGTALQSAANLPFIDRPESSPKLVALVNNVIKLKDKGSQVIYSSRIERGVDVIADLLKQRSPSSMKIEKIDGKVLAGDRTKIVKAYNTGLIDALIISPASARGVDLMKTYAFHLLEVHQNISEEKQTLTRAVRYKSHVGIEDPVVHVFQYLATFPTGKPSKSDVLETLQVAHETFGPEQCEGVTDELVNAVRSAAKKEKLTIDEDHAQRNIQKHKEVEQCLAIIRAASIPMPLSDAAGVEKPKSLIEASPTKIRNSIENWEEVSEKLLTSLAPAFSTEAKAKKHLLDILKDVAEEEGIMNGQDFAALIQARVTRGGGSSSSTKQRKPSAKSTKSTKTTKSTRAKSSKAKSTKSSKSSKSSKKHVKAKSVKHAKKGR